MWWHQTQVEFERRKGASNRRAMQRIVKAGRVPGLLAYDGRQPVGWIAVGPREGYATLGRSRVLKPVDDLPVWSVVCFFVNRDYRRRGVSRRLLEAAVAHVRRKGGKIIEGYPVEPRKESAPDVFVYTGLVAAFRQVGFVEVARRSPTRPIMRCWMNEP